MKKKGDELTPIVDLLTPEVIKRASRNVPTPIQQRLIDTAVLEPDEPRSILYQHSTFCQVFLPYRDPGDGVLIWNRSNGLVDLRLTAGEAKHPSGEWVLVPLPFGPKARLVLMHINQLAILNQSPHIELEDSLTAFVRRVLKLDPKGRNINSVKEQLRRLATSSIRLGIALPEQGIAATRKLEIITEFDVWFSKDERQRVLWPSYLDLSLDYFTSLQEHAVPLDEGHIAALSHNAMALDIYAWLAQRLHRVPPRKPGTISWPALHSQFGQGFGRLDNFRRVFTVALKEVLTLYKAAKIDLHEAREAARPKLVAGKMVLHEPRAKGLTLHNSPPPVRKLLVLV